MVFHKRGHRKKTMKKKGKREGHKLPKGCMIHQPSRGPSLIKYVPRMRGAPFPDTFRVPLRYNQNFTISTASINAWQAGMHFCNFKGNSLNIPAVIGGLSAGSFINLAASGVASQGLTATSTSGWVYTSDQAAYQGLFAAVYQYYLVLGSKISVTLALNSTVDNYELGVLPVISQVAGNSGNVPLMRQLQDHQYGKVRRVNTLTHSNKISHHMTTRKLYALAYDDKSLESTTAYGALYGADPGGAWQWQICIESNDGAAPAFAGLTFNVELEFDVFFSVPKSFA